MGLRETLNQKQHVVTVATAAIIVLAVGLIIYQLMPAEPPKPPTRAYYTTDDGATWFEDDIDKVTPFTKDGKNAYRAHVYKCGKGKPFVAWMESFTPEAKKALDAWYANPANKGKYPEKRYEYEETQKLVKKAGTPGWVSLRHPNADKITLVNCADLGQSGEALEIYPED